MAVEQADRLRGRKRRTYARTSRRRVSEPVWVRAGHANLFRSHSDRNGHVEELPASVAQARLGSPTCQPIWAMISAALVRSTSA